MKESFRKFFVISLILSILWLITILLSMVENLLVGFGIWYSPTIGFAIYAAISEMIENGKTVFDAIYYFFIALIGMPIAIVIGGVIFIPLWFIMAIIYGVSLFVAVIYGIICFIFLVIGLVFSIGLLASSAKSSKGNIKAAKTARVFAILGLVSLLFAGLPNVFSIISIFRYICILVAAIFAIIGCNKAIKAEKEVIEV